MASYKIINEALVSIILYQHSYLITTKLLGYFICDFCFLMTVVEILEISKGISNRFHIKVYSIVDVSFSGCYLRFKKKKNNLKICSRY